MKPRSSAAENRAAVRITAFAHALVAHEVTQNPCAQGRISSSRRGDAEVQRLVPLAESDP